MSARTIAPSRQRTRGNGRGVGVAYAACGVEAALWPGLLHPCDHRGFVPFDTGRVGVRQVQKRATGLFSHSPFRAAKSSALSSSETCACEARSQTRPSTYLRLPSHRPHTRSTCAMNAPACVNRAAISNRNHLRNVGVRRPAHHPAWTSHTGPTARVTTRPLPTTSDIECQ